MTASFGETYPNIAYWVEAWGWVEIGRDEYSTSFIKAFDAGGTVWEGADKYETLDDALHALDAALKAWIDQNE